MNDRHGPSRQESVVKARYFIPVETDDNNLQRIQDKLAVYLRIEGYTRTDVDIDLFGPRQRTITFTRSSMPHRKPSIISKVKSWFGFNKRNELPELTERDFLDSLERMVDAIPFRFVFYFKSTQLEDQPGYDVLVESTPALLQKFRQLNFSEKYAYNLNDVIEENKSEVRRIMGKMELEPYAGPYTEAEIVEPILANEFFELLDQHTYGRNAIQYLTEGDQCLQNGLLHAALSCYIQAIEWVILYYKITLENVDLIEEQKEDDKYFTFNNLVQKIEYGTPVKQKTLEKLNNINAAERKWAAHHKSGEITRVDVDNVRSTLFRLIDDLFG